MQEAQAQRAAGNELFRLGREADACAAYTAAIEALELPQLESLAEELLDFSGAADLLRWLELQQC